VNICIFLKLSNRTKFPVETTDKRYAPVGCRTHVLQMIFCHFAHIINSHLLHTPGNCSCVNNIIRIKQRKIWFFWSCNFILFSVF